MSIDDFCESVSCFTCCKHAQRLTGNTKNFVIVTKIDVFSKQIQLTYGILEPATSIIRKSKACSKSSDDKSSNFAAIETCFLVTSMTIHSESMFSSNSIFPKCRIAAMHL